MCQIVDEIAREARGVSRRSLLAAGGASAVVGLSAASASAAQPTLVAESWAQAKRFNTKCVLLGTAGGPIWYPGTDRQGIGTAVTVGDAVYLFDFGDGSGHRFKQADLVPEALHNTGGTWGEEKVRAMFVTHLHSDHVADYFQHFILGWSNGLRRRGDVPKIQVHGPGRRTDAAGNDVLEPIWTLPGQAAPDIPVNNPENPVPGIVDMTNYLFQAFSLDINDRMRDGRNPSLWSYFDIYDIDMSYPFSLGYHPNDRPLGMDPDTDDAIEPWKVYEDDRVEVLATLVDHRPIAPAFGFRVNSDDGSVVISGDTAPSKNLIKMAAGADVLVHEVISRKWVESLYPQPWTDNNLAQMNHLTTAHTLVEDVGKVAQQAGVQTLALSHIVPGNAPDEDLRPAAKDFDGKFVIGRDLMQIGVGAKAKTST